MKEAVADGTALFPVFEGSSSGRRRFPLLEQGTGSPSATSLGWCWCHFEDVPMPPCAMARHPDGGLLAAGGVEMA